MNIEVKRINKVVNNENTAMKDSLTVIGALPIVQFDRPRAGEH